MLGGSLMGIFTIADRYVNFGALLQIPCILIIPLYPVGSWIALGIITAVRKKKTALEQEQTDDTYE